MFLSEDSLQTTAFILYALINMLEFELACAKRHGFRNPLGDKTRLESAQSGQRNRGAVVGMETLGFNYELTMRVECSRTATSSRVLLALCGPHGNRKEKQLAVGENAVNVEQQEFDLLGMRPGRKFLRHRRDSSIAARGPLPSVPGANNWRI